MYKKISFSIMTASVLLSWGILLSLSRSPDTASMQTAETKEPNIRPAIATAEAARN